MNKIKDLLEKWRAVLSSGRAQTDAVREAVFEVVKIELKPEEVEIKNNIIFFKIKPIYKNEIFLKKDLIFLELKEKFGPGAPEAFR